METRVLKSGHKIKFYSDIQEFPAERRPYFDQYEIEATQLALDPSALAELLGTAIRENQEGKTEAVHIRLQNLFLSLTAIRESYEPDFYAFGVLLHEADDKLVTDFTPKALNILLKEIGVTVGEANEIRELVKKNSTFSVRRFSLGLN